MFDSRISDIRSSEHLQSLPAMVSFCRLVGLFEQIFHGGMGDEKHQWTLIGNEKRAELRDTTNDSLITRIDAK
jgi:hypothetical protein